MSQAYTQIVDNVRMVRRSWQTRRALEGVLLTAGVFVATLVLTAGLDQLSAPGHAARWALAAVLWAATATILTLFVIQPLRTAHPDDFFAALVEQRQPRLNNRIINALQLGREATPMSPRLVEAIVFDGARAADEIDTGVAVSSPKLKQNAMTLGGAVVFGIAYLLLAGPGAPVSLARVLLPGAEIRPFTYTTLQIDKPDHSPVKLLEGEPLEVVVRASGRQQVDASVNWTDSLGNRRAVRMARGIESEASAEPGVKERIFSYKFPAVDSSFAFHVTAGDARGDEIRVIVEPRPRIASMAVTYHYPAYTGLEPREVKDFDGHLHGLPQTKASLTVHANKTLDKLTMFRDDGTAVPFSPSSDAMSWSGQLTLTSQGIYYFKLTDKMGNEMSDPNRYSITLEADAPPQVGFARPGRDIQVNPEDSVDFLVVAQDDLGVGRVRIVGKLASGKESFTIHEWANSQPQPQKRIDLPIKKTVAELHIKAGDRLEYWADVLDRNNLSTQPGYGESRKFNISVLTPEQAQALLEKQFAEYARAITELVRLQRLNRNETEGLQPAPALVDRESMIRKSTLNLASQMEKNAFPLRTMIDDLNSLAGGEMAKVIAMLESYRDATNLDNAKGFAQGTVPVQEKIIESLEDMLKRINRDQEQRAALRRLEKTDQALHKEVTTVLGKLAKDLDRFLAEQRELRDRMDKMNKKPGDEAKGEDSQALQDAQHRLDRWKQWAKDSVDALGKLPEGFVKDDELREEMKRIFEEIEKKQRGPTTEISTPMEEGVQAVGTKIKEDFESWLMDKGDAVKITMEDPMAGKFEVPPYTLPEKLQDLVGDLIQDMAELDEDADDTTGTQGGNIEQSGWDVSEGPIASFGAVGKTGNQMPQDMEMPGRSGEGRRGKSTGQSVGNEARGMEGRPTPARLTNEKYEEGKPKTGKQLDPRGSTGGGKKTGGGTRGLQGGTPPDFSKDMDRLKETQEQLRERMQEIARQLDGVGRSSGHVNRALELMKGAEQDMTDQRYSDAARKRKTAIGELKAEQSQVEQAVSLSLQKAANLPPEMRAQISAGSQQALPEGYEDIVGAYYKALSGAGNEPSDAASNPK